MIYKNQVRMVAAHHLLAGVALHTRFLLPLFTEKRHGKCIRQRLTSHSCLTCQNIRMRYMICLYSLLKMFLYHLMTDYIVKSWHWGTSVSKYTDLL